MKKHPDKDAEDEGRDPEEPQEPFDEFDERIQEGLQYDPRLDSGVAPGERGGDLDFIQMSGLTAPPPVRPETPPPEEPVGPLDLDPGKPLSFYEEGVADVDASMVPAADDESSPVREYPSEPDNRAAMEHLRDMIAELTKDEGPIATPYSAEPAPVPPAEFEETKDLEPVRGEEPSFALEPVELIPRDEREPEQPTQEEVIAEETVQEDAIAETSVAEERDQKKTIPEETIAAEAVQQDVIAETPVAEEPVPKKAIPKEAGVEETVAQVPTKPFELTPREEEPVAFIPEPEKDEDIQSLEREVGGLATSYELSSVAESVECAEPAGALGRDIPEVREELEPASIAQPRSPRVYTPPPSTAPRRGQRAEPPGSQDHWGGPVHIPTVAEAEEAMYLRHSAPRTRRRRSGHRKHARRRLMRVAAGLIVLAALAVGMYEAKGWYEANVTNPAMLYHEAAALAAGGNYQEASAKFATFAQRNPGNDLRAEAQFAAAFNLQQIQPSSQDEAVQVYSRALQLFQAFLDENPAHVKAPRARTLMGRLHFELGQYEEAIELLRDPELRLLDPIAAVPAVRLLARSYAQLGQDDSARSYYLQAVGLQDNHTPDVDYMELGTLYRAMAERSSAAESRREYERMAVAQWTHAVQSPGIDPATKKELRAKIDVMRERALQDGARTRSDPEAAAEADPVDPSGALAPGEDLPWESLAPALDEDADAVAGETGEEDEATAFTEAGAADSVSAEDAEPIEMLEATPPVESVHHVESGDTLSGIAKTYGVSVADLMEWNELTHSVIQVGQALIVHGPKSQASDPSESLDENEEEDRESIS